MNLNIATLDLFLHTPVWIKNRIAQWQDFFEEKKNL